MEAEPEALLAARLLEQAAAEPAGLLLVTRSETRASRLHRAATALAGPDVEVLLLPGWDCLPYDRVSPSRAVMAARMALLAHLRRPAGTPRLLLVSAEAATQRLPSPAAWTGLRLEAGESLDPDTLGRTLERLGYRIDEVADEPGEAAIRGAVADVFVGGEGSGTALRIQHEDGRIIGIRRYDPVTQRSEDATLPEVTIGPASELVLPEESEETRRRGLEHALPHYCADLVAPIDLLPDAAVLLDPEVADLVRQRAADVEDAFRTRLALSSQHPDAPPVTPPDALYLGETAWNAALSGRRVEALSPESAAAELPDFLATDEPEEACLDTIEEALRKRCRVALAGRGRTTRVLARMVQERLGAAPQPFRSLLALRAAPPGSFGLLEADLEEGFTTADIVLIPTHAVRPTRRQGGGIGDTAALMEAMSGLRPGDAVIHADHGLGALRGVEPVDIGEARLDCLRLNYADTASRLVPFDELDRLWRYGAAAEGVTLDRLGSGSWTKRRAEAEAQVAETARALIDLARAREGATAPVLRPPAELYRRLADRFPFEPTPDQKAAIRDVLRDLAAGRPMDRLVCGDVGYGKTEVALRAAAAAALSGKQVAVLAPTTVLVRQHLETFRKRFAGSGIRVAALSRLTPAAEAREVKRAIAAGEVRIAIGTQALAAKGVRFADLGLVVIDEEQRFGTRQKTSIRALGNGVHVMAMSATPIPRTLQTALLGLQALSVIATPPAQRQPIRTLMAPLEDALLAQALRQEARRGGQSFVVCARIEDIAPMRSRIAALVPELSLLVAHGGLPAADVDEAMVAFADGQAEVLLSTNIVEAGLDVPRANTMLIWRPDRFGLSQLHQLRGRVGRGRTRGIIYLLTDPAVALAPGTARRLRTLEALDRVGAGFAISTRDLDLRGAGDLLGEAQAGHLKLVGIDLYRHLLDRALAMARGEAPPDEWTPHIGIGIDAFIPPEHVPEEALQVELHTRLGELMRRGDLRGLQELDAEAEDRFGPPPEPFRNLLTMARLAVLCRKLGVARLDVGPQAAAASFRAGVKPPAVSSLEESNGRLLLRRASADAEGRLAAAQAMLSALHPKRRPVTA